MCIDCLLAFPPFSSSARAGAKKALHKVSRPNSPVVQKHGVSEDRYGPPLNHDLNQEDLPVKSSAANNDSKKVRALDDGDSGVNHCEDSNSDDSMDPSTGMELDAVALIDMDGNHKEPSESSLSESKPSHEDTSDDRFVYEQDIEVEIETSLDDQLPVGSSDTTDTSTVTDSTSEVTKGTLSTLSSEHKVGLPTLTVTGGQTTGQSQIVGHLEVVLEYEEDDGRLKVAVMKASNLPSKKQGGFNNYRVRLSLRPNKQQSSKTRIRPVDKPVFRELFRFRQLPKEELSTVELLFKLHGCGKYGKEKLVGDAILNLAAMKAAAKKTFNIPLSQRD